jgi:ubiquinone/menaquinone biosynthesis C-methylase UbiE
MYDPRDKVVLDYGCGTGRYSVKLLEAGARHVTGIDISSREVVIAADTVAEAGFADRSAFLVVDAHRTCFRNASFDLVVGGSILHHLDIAPALRELRRILKPGGRAVFSEPLWHNPILRLGRTLTPSARTKDEHPLKKSDWELCASVFSHFQHVEHEFVTIPFMPLNLVLSSRGRRALAAKLSRMDDRVLSRWPRLRKHARITLLVLE